MRQETQLHARGSEAPITVLLVDDQRFIGLALEPTIILQDLVMPGISGLELVGLFRRNAATARTPIIVLSGNSSASGPGTAAGRTP